MKKSLLLIIALAFLMTGRSQTLLYGEYFDNGVMPATWLNVDQDGDGSSWYADTWDNPGGFTESYMLSASYDKNHTPKALTPENYLISPKIDLTGLNGTVSIRYTIQVGDADYPAEHYKLAVSTTGTDIANFSTILNEETCTAYDYYDSVPYWHERKVDLTPYIGQQIYLTWCHYDCTDQYRFYLDSVEVKYTPAPVPTMIFEEFFDNGTIPATWTNIDNDGDGLSWYADTWDNPGGFTESYVVSASYDKNHDPKALTPDNYMISPKIDLTSLTGTLSMRYTIQVGDEDYPEEHYKVAISTTGTNVADFSNIVKEETCTAAEYYDTPPYWHERIVDLTPYLGQKIYIAWVHFDCTDQYRFYLDSVQISNTVSVAIAKLVSSQISVYPNPVKGQFKVAGNFENSKLQLFTTDGHKVYQVEKVTNEAMINSSSLRNGVYLLRIESPKGTLTKKIIISN